MAKNLAQRKGETGGAAKKGLALLSGLMRCGCCGRGLQVLYSGSDAQVGRYVCNSDRVQRGSSACLSVGSLRTDGAVVAEVLAAVEPAGIEAALKASEQARLEDHEKHRAVELAPEKARYESQRQFDAVEPEHRLVAAELEARWNQALARASKLESRVQVLQVEAAQRLQVSDTVVERLIRRGILPARQVVKYAPWVIEEKDLELPTVQAAVQAVQKGKRIPSALAEHPELPMK
jgi:hypothetical protein